MTAIVNRIVECSDEMFHKAALGRMPLRVNMIAQQDTADGKLGSLSDNLPTSSTDATLFTL
jgi:hypothetical protein